MRLVNAAWIVGGLLAVGLGMTAQACSSSNNNGPGVNCATLQQCCGMLAMGYQAECNTTATSGPDTTCAAELVTLGTACTATGSSTGTGASTGTGTGVAGTGTGLGGTGTGMGTMGTGTGTSSTGTGSGSCETAPTKVYAETTAGPYCPFSTVGSGGGAGNCPAGETCCEPASGSSTCVAAGTACTAGDTSWACEGAADCATSAAGKVCCGTGTAGMQVACGTQPAFAYGSDFTGSACAASCASSYVICSQQSECTTGTCTPIKAKGNDFGYCAP